jgi:hypothetical protein
MTKKTWFRKHGHKIRTYLPIVRERHSEPASFGNQLVRVVPLLDSFAIIPGHRQRWHAPGQPIRFQSIWSYRYCFDYESS